MTLKFNKKIIKTFMSALWWIMVAAMVLLLVSVLGAKFRGEVPQIFGYSVMRIISGSMEPEIETGSYILVRRCAPEDVKKGDIISFYSEDPMIYGLPNTHRVVEDPIPTESGYTFITRGDANVIEDKIPASSDKLIGIYEGSLNWLTSFSNALDGNLMFIILISLQAATVAIVAMSIIKKSKDDNEE